MDRNGQKNNTQPTGQPCVPVAEYFLASFPRRSPQVVVLQLTYPEVVEQVLLVLRQPLFSVSKSVADLKV